MFDEEQKNWYKQIITMLQLAKSKGFWHVYANDMKPCLNMVYLTMLDNEVKKVYNLNDKAYQFLILSAGGIAFHILNQAKITDLIDGDVFLALTQLKQKYAPNNHSDLIRLNIEFHKCTLTNTKQDPDEWFI
jgi:hypothetical protein